MVKKARLVYWAIFIFTVGGLPLCYSVFIQSPWMTLVSGGWFLILCYISYLRLVKKKEPKYPLVPPEGKPDAYTGLGIPRPIHEDLDEMKRKRKKVKE